MADRMLSKTEAFSLTGSRAHFLRDNVFSQDGDKVLYSWRAGDDCHLGGVVQRQGDDPVMLVFYGNGMQDVEELSLHQVPTELATADRRHEVFES